MKSFLSGPDNLLSLANFLHISSRLLVNVWRPDFCSDSSYDNPGSIILKARFWTLSTLAFKQSGIADQTGAAYSRIGLIKLQYTDTSC